MLNICNLCTLGALREITSATIEDLPSRVSILNRDKIQLDILVALGHWRSQSQKIIASLTTSLSLLDNPASIKSFSRAISIWLVGVTLRKAANDWLGGLEAPENQRWKKYILLKIKQGKFKFCYYCYLQSGCRYLPSKTIQYHQVKSAKSSEPCLLQPLHLAWN